MTVHGHRLLRAVHGVVFWLVATFVVLYVAAVAVTAVTGARMHPVTSSSMSPGIPRYSLVVAAPVRAYQVRVGDVLIFKPPPGFLPVGDLVMHRVVDLQDVDGAIVMRTKGDANGAVDPWRVDLNTSTVYRITAHVPRAGTVLMLLRNAAHLRRALPLVAGIAFLAAAAWYARRLCLPSNGPSDPAASAGYRPAHRAGTPASR